MEQEIIKAGASVLGKAYDDFVHPSAKSLGNTISLIPRTVGVWLQGWERWVINGEESIRRTAEAVGDRASEIPEEHLVEPPSHVAVPAIQQLAYCYDSEELREMYAKLLLSSMDDRSADLVHPGFVQILKEICPDEAKLLGSLALGREDGDIIVPTIDLRVVYSKDIIPYRYHSLVSSYSNCCEGVCENPGHASMYLGNLERLGLVQHTELSFGAYDDVYDSLEHSDVVTKAKESFALSEGMEFDFARGSYQVTDYGDCFIRTCVEDRRSSDQPPAE